MEKTKPVKEFPQRAPKGCNPVWLKVKARSRDIKGPASSGKHKTNKEGGQEHKTNKQGSFFVRGVPHAVKRGKIDKMGLKN